MKSNERNERMEDLLECLIQIIGRVAIPADKVYDVIGNNSRQIKAFNLCDGSNGLTKIAKQCGIDKGSFSRTTSRWVENGIAFWVGRGKDARLSHVYPIPESLNKNRKRGK